MFSSDYFDVRKTTNPIFSSPERSVQEPEVIKLRRPGISTNRIILDIENDPNLDCHTVQWSSQAGKILNSEKQPVTSHRTTFAKYEKEKLFSEIDCAIEKSKILNTKARQRIITGSDFIEIDCPEPLAHRDLTLPSYCGRPYHISVRSTKEPKINIYGQRPEITRRTLNEAKPEFSTTRRQPDIEVSIENKPDWKLGFHGKKLEYAKYLEKKHGKAQIDRYFGTKKLQEAAESLIFEKTEGWSDLANEYRKELKIYSPEIKSLLKRQSEKARLSGPRSKWWESHGPDFHYHYHKNEHLLKQADHHHQMELKYLRQLNKSCANFWA